MQDFIVKYWPVALYALLVAAAGAGWRFIIKLLREQAALRDGMRALLRDRIIEVYNHSLDRGYCPIYARENLHALHKAYKALNGNGTADDLVEKADAMPTAAPALPAGG